MEDVNYSLISAVREGRLERAREIINRYGLSYSNAWSGGYILLRDAVENKHAAVAKLLLTSGSKVNSKRSIMIPSDTPLHYAVKNGNIEIVKMILDKGANINAKNEWGKTPLHNAVETNKINVTKLLLNHRADVNARDKDGTSLLHVAVEKKCLQIVEGLLKYGANVNFVCTSKSERGYAPLHLAVEKGSKDFVVLILSKGANVDVKGYDNITPLHIAAKNGCIDIAEDLLNHGACPNAITNKGYTPLHFASELGKAEFVKLLLKKSTNGINANTNCNFTPLHIAAKEGFIHIAEDLLNHGACISSCTNEGYTPLHFACELGRAESVKLFLNKGADINASTNSNLTPLHIAAKKGYIHIAKYLLNLGACTISSTNEGYTPLHFASKLGYEKAVELFRNEGAYKKGYIHIAEDLLNHGACTNSFTNEGYTPLHFASELGYEEAVELLLNKGADANAITKTNLTPLHISTKEQHKSVVKLLLQHGAKVDNYDEDGKTILNHAVEKGCLIIVEDILKYCPDINDQSNRSSLKIAVLGCGEENEKIVEALLEYGLVVNPEHANSPELLHTAVEKGYLKIIKDLLTYGADVNTLCKSTYKVGFTPLHSAAENKQLHVAKLLISYNANINAQDETGKTPIFYSIENADLKTTKLLLTNKANIKGTNLLHIAVKKKCIEMVKALLENGADINASDEDGRTALHFTAFGKFNWMSSFFIRNKEDPECNIEGEMAKLLLSKGANVEARTKDGVTTLHYAIHERYSKIVEVLLNYDANANSGVKSDITPLHLSAQRGNEKISKMLLDKGANVNAKQKDGISALHIAVQRGHKQIVKVLLECGAKVDDKDEDGKTILHHAVEKGCLIIVEDILKYCPDINDQSNRSSLKIAVLGCGEENEKIVEALLEYGLVVNPEDANSPELLHTAVKKGYLKIIEDLLTSGADVNTLYETTYNKEGFTLLHSAAKNKHEDVAKLLISYNANINAQDKTGKTPIFYSIENADLKTTKLLLTNRANIKGTNLLHIAVKKKCIEIIEVLLESGADINANDEDGRTALHFTALREINWMSEFCRNEDDPECNIEGEMAKLLLSKGADVDAQSTYGTTTLYCAIKKRCTKVVEALLIYNANVNSVFKSDITPLHISVQERDEEISRMLLNEGAIVNAKQQDGTTALHIATQYGQKELVEVLLEYGAEVDSKMIKSDITPLHVAAQRGHEKIIRAILKSGANINSRDEFGRTALHIASEEGHEHVVVALLDNGSDINITSINNHTPLDCALVGKSSSYRQLNNYNSGDYGYCAADRVYSRRVTAEILKRHIVKMKTANLYVSEHLLSITLHSSDEIRDFQSECEKEISSMKSEKINTANISFYDILAKGTSSVAVFMKNEYIVQGLKSEYYKRKFPIYACMIKSHFKKGMERKEILEQANEIFICLFVYVLKLPYDCTEQIFSYLSNEDLKILKDACKPLSIRK